MAQAIISPPARRTCEECLAIRALVSPPHLRRILPKPALSPVAGPTPAQQLRALMAYPFPEPVYHRLGQRALDENDPTEIAEAIATLQRVKTQHEAGQAKLHAAFPKLYPKAA